jgi:hypothetical protein
LPFKHTSLENLQTALAIVTHLVSQCKQKFFSFSAEGDCQGNTDPILSKQQKTVPANRLRDSLSI